VSKVETTTFRHTLLWDAEFRPTIRRIPHRPIRRAIRKTKGVLRWRRSRYCDGVLPTSPRNTHGRPGQLLNCHGAPTTTSELSGESNEILSRIKSDTRMIHPPDYRSTNLLLFSILTQIAAQGTRNAHRKSHAGHLVDKFLTQDKRHYPSRRDGNRVTPCLNRGGEVRVTPISNQEG
jgi:hypothetical protein